MKNKKGFVFIETIIVIVILSAALLIIYSSFNSAYIKEKRRVYYDDPAYIYKSYYIGKFIVDNTIFKNKEIINNYIYDGNDTTKPLATIIGAETENLFNSQDDVNTYRNMASNYNLYQLVVLKPDFNIISKCTNKVINSSSCDAADKECKVCKSTFSNNSSFDLELKNYIRTLGSYSFNNDYIFIMYYKESYWGSKACDVSNSINCHNNNYFVWLDSGVTIS
jgi:prepilin-type N-terminal cleavage/methylation domain-containing protein